MRPVSIPVVSARSKLSASARIWRPAEVARSIAATANRTTNAITTTYSSVVPIVRPVRSSNQPTVDVRSESSWRGLAPQMNWIMLRRTNASPSAIRRSWSIPAFFFRIGRHMMSSEAMPNAAVASTPASNADDERRVQRHVERERDVGAEGQHVAVGEVDELQDPVDERQADRAEREVRAGDDAVDGPLAPFLRVPRRRSGGSRRRP